LFGSEAPPSKDVIDLLERKSALLTDQVSALERENAQLCSEIVELRQKLQRFQPVARELAQEHLAILKILESEDRNWPVSEVASAIAADLGRTHYLLTKLRREKYVYEVPVGFHIDDKGREALHESLSNEPR
jgi:predicted RNase H-like nuclease (RuvC/YqgF family)